MAKNPHFLNRVQFLKNKGFPADKIIGILIANNYLQEMTTDLARKTFGITWLEKTNHSDLYRGFPDLFYPNQTFPNLIIVNMGQAGFGLFAAEAILKDTYIAEYTGEILQTKSKYLTNPGFI